jgi:hypothetical protein
LERELQSICVILTEKDLEKEPPEVTTVRITGDVDRPRSMYTARENVRIKCAQLTTTLFMVSVNTSLLKTFLYCMIYFVLLKNISIIRRILVQC